MTVQIIDCDQNSPEWHLARMGLPTASSFADILTPAKTKGAVAKTRQTYLMKLAGELLTGAPMEMPQTFDMKRGHELEPEARDLYSLQTSAPLTRVGFVKNNRAGCSPDSLIGDDGGLEIKTKAPHLLIETILRDEFPEEHKAQVQGAMWITGRKWWDLAVYWPGLPLFVKRVERDEAYIATLADEVDHFNADLDGVVGQMRERVEADNKLSHFAQIGDFAPSAELLASRIVVEATKDLTSLAPNGMPTFLDRTKPAIDPAHEKMLADLEAAFGSIADTSAATVAKAIEIARRFTSRSPPNGQSLAAP